LRSVNRTGHEFAGHVFSFTTLNLFRTLPLSMGWRVKKIRIDAARCIEIDRALPARRTIDVRNP
jgi:hypothetical protein